MAIDTLALGDIRALGKGLIRPECVVATSDGTLLASNFAGGVSVVGREGVRHVVGRQGPKICTNGFALCEDGTVLCANLMPPGGVWRLTSGGDQAPYLLDVEGVALPPCNFVHVDGAGRVWITVSTWLEPRARAYRSDVADGSIILVDQRGARLAATNLGYTNEAILDPSERYLYVNETFARRTSRFAVGDNGTLGPRETVAEYGAGIFPDGLAFDEDGALWVTSIISNRLIRVEATGEQTTLLEDCDPDWLEEVESAYLTHAMERAHLDKAHSTKIGQLSSLAFAGRDRRTLVLGSLLDDHLHTLKSPVAGAKPAHWDRRFML